MVVVEGIEPPYVTESQSQPKLVSKEGIEPPSTGMGSLLVFAVKLFGQNWWSTEVLLLGTNELLR